MMMATLLRASVDGAIVAAAIWVATRYMRGLSPSTRAALWWCAAAKFVIALFWITPIAIPVLPAEMRATPVDIPSSADSVRVADSTSSGAVASDGVAPSGVPSSTAPSSTVPSGTVSSGTVASAFRRKLTLPTILLAGWAGGVLIAMFVGFHRWRRTMGIVSRASVAPLEIQAMVAHLATRLRLRGVPDVRVSREIDTPLVAGLLRPSVLVPAARFGTLSAPQQQMAICHELSHIARSDLWLGCVPALAERLFFFHPLVRLASREYVFWRESACDAAVLEALDAAPQAYGRLLLDLGVTQPRTSLAAAGAPWSLVHLKRRIVMLGNRSRVTFGSRMTAALVLAVSAVLIAPLQPVARASVPLPAVQNAAPSTSGTLARSPAPSSTPVNVEASADQRTQDRQKESDLNYVMFLGDERTWMSGSRADVERTRRLRQRGEHLLWFRLDGREYVVRDRASMENVEQLWRRVTELGDAQGVLGTEQGELGTKQGAIGTRQGEIGTEQGRLGTRQGELGTRQGQMAMRDLERMTADQRAEFDKARRQIEIEMRELDREMRALDVKMRDLDRPMRDLGVEMEKIGKEMEQLGRQMEEEGRKAEQEMRALLRRLIASGVAEVVK